MKVKKSEDQKEKTTRGWIVIGAPVSGDILVGVDLLDGWTVWTAHRDMQIGDYVFFYITAPIKTIIVAGRVTSKPKLQDDPAKEWYKKFMAKINALREMKTLLTIEELKYLFPDWRYWLQPRSAAAVPDDALPNLIEASQNKITIERK